MKAKVGDWLVVKGTTVDKHDQRGVITEVRSSDGSPPYVVRWLNTDHVATVFPGPDAIINTPAEQEAADKRAQHHFGSVQSKIAHHGKGASP
ncbi:MAG: hypothetical protein QOG79_1963 [Mycobacterium sp.]|jgi:hypothetical protein|nr:hypothetical protein [Mycobacterium sp.]MDT5196096.1 hypothetical protein [Mycobacterium sp.]MDT5240429.1 hypothetical protein [Mycobacterium sp.]MDT5286912.1 hypothetical protein [Mycobacterium sp.]MDT5298721.1 hypothetical protein [Mycobacterium sp.]